MDLARFESELTELLGDPHADDREARIAALRAACDRFPGGRELVALLDVGPEQRDPIEDPGAAYWESLHRRLHARIAGERSRPARSRAWLVAGSAAALLLAASAVWMLRPRAGAAPTPSAGGSPAVDARAATDPGVWLPDELEARFAAADRVELAAMDWVGGADDAWLLEPDSPGAPEVDDGWLFPETFDLDDEARRELLDWIAAHEAPGGAA